MADAVHARTQAATNNPTNENEDLDGGEDVYDDGEEEGDDDDDIDAAAEAAAEEIARRLGAQLWESISKAQAEGATLQAAPTKPPTKREEAALATMRNVLAFVDRDPLARSTLASTPVLECEGRTLLDVLMGSVAAGRISKAVARPLSTLMLNLSQSEILFASLEQRPVQQDKAKRKRSDSEEEDSSQDPSPRLTKRPCYTPYDLRTQIIEAVRTIVETFASNQKASVDASVISSMQLQLHQVFLFAVTSSASSGPEMSAMREISGLIQALAVLSGIQIGGPSSAPPHSHASPAPSTWEMIPPPVTDIGTAVYPCIAPTCPKVFSRLSFLRAHQQRVHALHRPFICSSCSAAFARNHDLKRHAQLHEKKAWKCGGCEKIFSRRDAIKRHKNNGSSRGRDGQPCLNKKVIEVDLEKTEGDETDGRRTKVRTASGPVPAPIQHDDGLAPEEGEILPNVIAQLQAAVLSLIEPLRAHMRQALSSGPQQSLAPPNVSTDTTGGQATLASVIAHVQAQTSGNLGTTTMTQDPVEVGPLAMYGLSEEQTRMLQQAIANAASAAQAQAEAEAALEEEEEEEEVEDGDLCGGEDDGDGSGEDVDDGKTADGSAFDSPIQPDSTG